MALIVSTNKPCYNNRSLWSTPVSENLWGEKSWVQWLEEILEDCWEKSLESIMKDFWRIYGVNSAACPGRMSGRISQAFPRGIYEGTHRGIWSGGIRAGIFEGIPLTIYGRIRGINSEGISKEFVEEFSGAKDCIFSWISEEILRGDFWKNS